MTLAPQNRYPSGLLELRKGSEDDEVRGNVAPRQALHHAKFALPEKKDLYQGRCSHVTFW